MFAVPIAGIASDFTVGTLNYKIRENNTCTVDSYETPENPEPNLVIPSTVTYEGTTYTVVGIDFYAISDQEIETVEIPATVTYMEYSAFENCVNLTTVTGCAGLTRMDEDVFKGCESLQSVSLGDNLETIGENVFYECASLTEITGGAALKTIGNYAFYYCTGLTRFNFPKGLTTLGESCFEGSGLTEVKLPSTITALPARLFCDCASLTNADLSALSAIFTDIDNMGEHFGESIFENCTALTSITVPADATFIPDYLCTGTAIEEFDFPTTLTYIGQAAFSNTPLKNVVIPDNVWGIDQWAFNGCTSLLSLDMGQGVEEIGLAAFEGCENLKTVKVSPALRMLDLRAFTDDTSVTDVYITNLSGWCAIEAAGFGSRPGEAVSEWYNMYLNDELLTNLTIPDGVTDVKDYAFNNVGNITAVTLPESLQTIGEWSFRALTEMANDLVIPDNVTEIGESAFWWNNHSKELTIGKSVTSIGRTAFGSWENLETVNCRADVPPTCGDMVFSYISQLNLKVPKHSIEAYKADAYWGQFGSITALPYEGPAAPEHLYVIGAIKDCDWSTDNSPEMTCENNIFTATVTLTDAGNFKLATIRTATPGDWDGENGINKSMCYGQAQDNAVITLGEQFNLVGIIGNVGAINTGRAGTFTITADFTDPEAPVCMVKEDTSSIPTIGAENEAPVEYYNLQGICIDKPAAGETVIRRQGTNVAKIVVR